MKMSLPKQVEEAAELAEELHEKMFSQEKEEDTQEVEEVEEEVQKDVEQDDVEAVPHDDDIEELRKFKARYLSLQGKYNAEVPRLQHELHDLKQSVFEKLEQRTAQPQQTPAPVPDKYSAFAEEYGEEFVGRLRELIEIEAERKIRETIQPVQQHVASVEDTQIKAAQQSFIGYLDQAVNENVDWRKMWSGEDPKFMEFLQQPDPSGLYTYGDLAQAYNNNWDADRLAKIFNMYAEAQAPPARPSKPNPAKEAMVAPSRNTNHTVPQSTNKQIWTSDSIKQFQIKDRRGDFSPEESKAMWDDLLSAPSENRIR